LPSDFCLFGKGKSTLIGPEIPDETAIIEAAIEILNRISDAELERVFRSWIKTC
jgi:sulfate adenylyltransferase subunit 1 (EFTu-like GTPase family)